MEKRDLTVEKSMYVAPRVDSRRVLGTNLYSCGTQGCGNFGSFRRAKK